MNKIKILSVIGLFVVMSVVFAGCRMMKCKNPTEPSVVEEDVIIENE